MFLILSAKLRVKLGNKSGGPHPKFSELKDLLCVFFVGWLSEGSLVHRPDADHKGLL